MKPVLFGILLSLFALAASAQPSSGERTWRFKVFLDKRAIGYHTFHIADHPGGSTAQIDAHFKVKLLFVTVYNYRFTNHERWQNGCLRQIDSTAVVNSKHYAVHGNMSGSELEVQSKVNDAAKVATLPGCVMTFAYWNPAMLQRSRLLNTQTGAYVDVDTRLVGRGPIDVEGTQVQANHYRLTSNKLTIDLWYTTGGEWLQLESELDGGRTLRYQLVKPSVADLQLAAEQPPAQRE